MIENNITGISTSFTTTLIDSNLSDITMDVSEAYIDQIFNDGVLKDIPIVNTIVGLVKTTRDISNFLFLKKILAFLYQLNNIDKNKRLKMISKIDNSKKYRLKVGEKLLYIIDRCDDYEKSEYIAIMFKSLINDKISYELFQECASVINDISIVKLKSFIELDVNADLDDINCHEYARYGLIGRYDVHEIREKDVSTIGKNLSVGKLYNRYTDIGIAILTILKGI